VTLLAVFLTAWLGFACLALSQRRHWHAVTGRGGPPRRLVPGLRVLGAAGLILSLSLALWRDGPSFGSLLWVTSLSLMALLVALVLARYQR